MTAQTLSILGSTGSIGTQTLEVAAHLGVPVAALAAGRNIALLEDQVRRFSVPLASVFDQKAARLLKIALQDTNCKVLSGEEGLHEAAQSGDRCVTAITGIAGLKPTLAAIEAGRDIALANKETLVCAGELVMARADAKGIAILPVDSEHSAIFQCLAEKGAGTTLKKILLTASGGPFFGKSKEQLSHITVRDALSHPNWTMGPKITVDSATLMNKGLEFIEAMRLYRASPDQIEVLVHRESIVHSMVEYCDGSVLAQLSLPDMRLPIQYALTWPDRYPSLVPALDFSKIGSLTFYPPDEDAFPCLALAKEAAGEGGGACATLNGANEAAVELFLSEKVRFMDIPELIAHTISKAEKNPCPDLAAIFELDREARRRVYERAGIRQNSI